MLWRSKKFLTHPSDPLKVNSLPPNLAHACAIAQYPSVRQAINRHILALFSPVDVTTVLADRSYIRRSVKLNGTESKQSHAGSVLMNDMRGSIVSCNYLT